MTAKTTSANPPAAHPALLGAAIIVLATAALLLLPEQPPTPDDVSFAPAATAFASTDEVDPSRIGLDASRLAPGAGASASDVPGVSIGAYGN